MSDYTNNQTFKPGDRVEFHPGVDLWARGAKYATVVRVLKGQRLEVDVDRLNRTTRTSFQSVRHIAE
jgi:hypothetical protein